MIETVMNWVFRRRYLPYRCLFAVDCVIIFCSGLLTNMLINRPSYTLLNLIPLCNTLLVFTFCSAIGLRTYKTYCSVIRYSSYVDLLKMGKAMFLSFILSFIVHYPLRFFSKSVFLPIGGYEIFVMFVLAVFLTWLLRVVVKNVYDVAFLSDSQIQTLVYGLSDKEIGYVKSLHNKRNSNYAVVGFLSDDAHKAPYLFLGKPVYLLDGNLGRRIKEDKIKAVVVLSSRIEEFRERQNLQDLLLNSGVRIYKYNTTEEWNLDTAQEENRLKEVSVEDLLPRDVIEIDLKSIEDTLKGKRILITGAAGSIGSELVKLVASFRPERLLLIDQAETPLHDIRIMARNNWPSLDICTVVASVTDHNHMESLFKTFSPEFVFHAAAYKHVPMMEDNPCESVRNNVWGTKVIADLSVTFGVSKFVMVSTDKAVNPTNVMGCSKRICEIYVQSLDTAEKRGEVQGHTQFVTTRFGNVLGSNGSVIPLFEKQIQKGGPVTVTDPNVIRYFMLIPEACKLVLEAGVKGAGGEIFVFDMGKPVRIADLAQRMIQMSNAKGIKIVYTGLRPGEKLYEEVLAGEEKTVKTSFNSKIRIANIRKYAYTEAEKDVLELIGMATEFDDMATVKKMKQIVPEFKSNNSVYSVLDV